MGFKEFYFGHRAKLNRYKIIQCVHYSKHWNKSGLENIESAQTMLLWEGRYQNSWLVRTNRRLYKILDDLRLERPVINWSKDLRLFKEGTAVRSFEYFPETGKIIFTRIPQKEYLYSKKFFRNTDIERVIKEFVRTS